LHHADRRRSFLLCVCALGWIDLAQVRNTPAVVPVRVDHMLETAATVQPPRRPTGKSASLSPRTAQNNFSRAAVTSATAHALPLPAPSARISRGHAEPIVASPEGGPVDYSHLADKALAGDCLTRDEARAVLGSPDEDLLDLLAAAYRVRRQHWGKQVQLHVLQNAKSGLCPEDCNYCSQSSVSDAEIDKYPYLEKEQILEAARRAKNAGAVRYCIVASGRGPTANEIEYVSDVVRTIKREMNIELCACVGILDKAKAQALADAGVDRLNHNLNTSERFSPEIVTSHTYADRIGTLKAARDAGLELCTGAIFGMGETNEDIVDVLMDLREIGPDSIPINFLIPIQGTPLESVDYLTPNDCLRQLALARFLNPSAEIRIAGGREVHLRSMQAMGLYAANSIFVAGYLTTPGQKTEDAHAMIADMGFEVVAGEAGAITGVGEAGSPTPSIAAPVGASSD
jgi:biotin synthase